MRRSQVTGRHSRHSNEKDDRMPDGQDFKTLPQWVLWVAVGRQRVGKTTLLNTAIQYFRAHGSSIEIWNADQQNRTHSLSTFFPDALVPPGGGLMDNRMWIEQRLVDQSQRGYHAVLDAGGGATGFSNLIEDVPILDILKASNIHVVAVYNLGTEQADLDFMTQCAESGLFVPERTVIVLNAGLVLSGRSAANAFAPIMEHDALKAATRGGAKVVMMPALSCMSEVTDRGLTFAEAASGIVRPGQTPMSLFDPVRVREWWTKKVPQFFGQFPPEWLPMTPQVADPLLAKA
jgi:hypothetical protein